MFPFLIPHMVSPGVRMAMSPQQFCLRWNNHQSNIISVFEQLLQSESFVDVTLAVEGMTLKAHKVVLSACSPYFQAVLASHPDKHPIVILKDVRYTDMRDLLDFMYRGEVSVDQDNLSGFLRVAESLRIKGLTEVNEKKRLESTSSTSSAYLVPQAMTGAAPPSVAPGVVPMAPLTPLAGDPPPLKRPPLSPSATYGAKRRRGRPPKISGEESEGEVGSVAGSVSAAEGEDNKSEAEVKVEVEEVKESFEPDDLSTKEPDTKSVESNPGPSGESQGKEVTRLPSDDQENTRESPGSEVCCVPDIWTAEGGVVRGSTPIKQERPTPTPTPGTPTTTPAVTPATTPTPLLTTPSLPSILAPIQQVPLDLVIDSCDGNELEQNVTLDYVLNSNGTATCKLCGELLPSRNHWYRHKYKTHATALYRCDDCGVVYKSKKGYETHMEVKHAKVKPSCGERPRKRDWQTVNKSMEEAKRQQEEAMVSAIIARVKLECAMEGEDCSRRGYQKH
ncbi:protein bric-a-brac 1-like isoform X4 [Portunus trituberculatus]|uniref:protein bric-a-brac 1-like isoform X4 n=1 Tax=Portunus trituberculatus TaxID=210409 RepID=UPI001E1CC84B|nr:protein bric-a-brac 1-like isoform X4 [Portunus trituberculatus]